MATNIDLEVERQKEIDRLITEQSKDAKSNRVLPSYVRGHATFTFPIDPEILEDSGLVYNDYHGWVKDDVI